MKSLARVHSAKRGVVIAADFGFLPAGGGGSSFGRCCSTNTGVIIAEGPGILAVKLPVFGVQMALLHGYRMVGQRKIEG